MNMSALTAEMARAHKCEYKGDFRAGKRHGDGEFLHTIGVGGSTFSYEYDGEWKHDVRHHRHTDGNLHS